VFPNPQNTGKTQTKEKTFNIKERLKQLHSKDMNLNHTYNNPTVTTNKRI